MRGFRNYDFKYFLHKVREYRYTRERGNNRKGYKRRTSPLLGSRGKETATNQGKPSRELGQTRAKGAGRGAREVSVTENAADIAPVGKTQQETAGGPGRRREDTGGPSRSPRAKSADRPEQIRGPREEADRPGSQAQAGPAGLSVRHACHGDSSRPEEAAARTLAPSRGSECASVLCSLNACFSPPARAPSRCRGPSALKTGERWLFAPHVRAPNSSGHQYFFFHGSRFCIYIYFSGTYDLKVNKEGVNNGNDNNDNYC